MKRFLFLYPIREYMEREIRGVPGAVSALERLNAIIDRRYRRRGYQVHWLLFSQETKPDVPDLSLLDPRIAIHETDKIISAGVSRAEHRKFIYPSCKRILTKLGPVSELVLGGFHQTDCVDKVARAAHRGRVAVTVDEDTTNQFFETTRLQELPPVTRSRKKYASNFRAILQSMESMFSRKIMLRAIKEHRAERKCRPWLVQI
jgi:hypothetical protein